MLPSHGSMERDGIDIGDDAAPEESEKGRADRSIAPK
jgi:hypothetical protein